MRRSYPEDYEPLNFCRQCGRDFASGRTFDQHRVGVHDYTLAEGLRMDPPREDGRRCLYDAELLELGLRPFTDDELRASPRDRRRAGNGVELWHDPETVRDVRERRSRMPLRADASRAEAHGGDTPATSYPRPSPRSEEMTAL